MNCKPTALTWDEEEEDQDAHGDNDDPRHYKWKTPVVLNKDTCDDWAQNIANGRMRIPDAHYKATPGKKVKHVLYTKFI